MAAVQPAMLGNLPYTSLRDALFTHPTAAEGVHVAPGECAAIDKWTRSAEGSRT